MRIIFEEHQYKAADVQDELKEICALQDVEKNISVGYVGYFYNSEVNDCVFILPKVLLDENDAIANIPPVKDERGNERRVTPEDIITPEGQRKCLTPEYRKFIYEFAVWIYRTLCVYRKQNPKSKAVYYKPLPQEGRGRKQEANTFLDIILSLIRFNRENQNFFLFTIKNLHSGQNKINWTRTISKSECVIQDGAPVYPDPVNKKRQINFDEELFVIFFSILNYLNKNYGFNAPINCRYDLITGRQFDALLKGMGKTRLRRIRYKYFSDKTLLLWDLCYAFFDSAYKISVNVRQQEYLLAKSFEYVFEAMIDDLIGERNIPKGLKEQRDGKRVDHFYTYDSLTSDNSQSDGQIYYIGDSKYYKAGNKLGRESVYKQYTYARNVIQWNIDLFMENQKNGWTEEERQDYESDKNEYGKIRLRDDGKDPLTEGYNVIPNFFLSAYVNENRLYKEKKNIKIHADNGERSTYISSQFNDRLFDRDTLILSHYDVNFLYVVCLYARQNRSEKAAWKQEVRKLFRNEIRKVLNDKYHFFAMKSKGNPIAGEEFVKDHFKELQGKLFRPYGDKNIYSLALEKPEGGTEEEKLQNIRNGDTFKLLSEFFEIDKVNLGDNPREQLEKKVEKYRTEHPYSPVPKNWLPEYHIERYLNDYFVVGMYHDSKHWDWITGKNDRGTLIYNVRLDPNREGAQVKSRIRQMKPKFAVLYEKGREKENNYHVFRIHDFAVMSEERMRQAQYPRTPQGDYFIFRFDEEVSLGGLNLRKFIEEHRVNDTDFKEGAPLYPKGEELMKFRK